MNIQVHHVIVHTPEQVREILAEANRIAEEADYADNQWPLVFEKAVELLGARFTMAVPQEQVPMDLGRLGANHLRKGR